MIYFNLVDFSERRSEEVMFHLTFSIYIFKQMDTLSWECCTVEPRYNEVLGTMQITLLYQVSHYIRVKNTKKYKELGPAKLPCYKRVLLSPTSL